MKEYLIGTIEESLRRVNLLTLKIPSPLPAPDLSGVSQRCTDRLHDCTNILNGLKDDPDLGNPDYYRVHFRILRRVVRSLFEVEVYALPAMARFTKDEYFLTRFLFNLHQEMKFPLQAPIGACFASGYYWSHPDMNVIYVPLAESDMLLHLPDLAHEMAHILIHFSQDARVAALSRHYEQCRQIVNQYYVQRMLNRRTAGGPAGYLRLENHFRQQWLDKWLLEMVCDLFAVYVLGPSFVWAHSHLVGKMCNNAYLFSHDNITTHPADEARMKAMQIGLGLLGFDQESKAIDFQWKKIIQVLGHQKDADYHLAYPDALIESIAVEIFRGTTELGCNLMTAAKLSQSSQNSMIALMNNAWIEFWKNPELYPSWEQNTVRNLKNKIIPDLC